LRADAAASTASIPAIVTIMMRPSVGWTAEVLKVIWVQREAEYFCKWGWTEGSPNRRSDLPDEAGQELLGIFAS
jgi:hypothetical protein